MNNNFDVLCDEIYVDYVPYESEEDFDDIGATLYTLGLRYFDVMDNCDQDYCDAYKPLELYFGRIFEDKGDFYDFMNGRCERPEVVDAAELERYYERYYLHAAPEVYQMAQRGDAF